MKFPFEITKKFKLANNEFDGFTTTEIIENVFDYLSKQKFVFIGIANKEIKLQGDKDKYKFMMSWHDNYRIVNFIDSGKICILESENDRKLIYTFRFKWFLIHQVTAMLICPVFIYTILKLMDIDIKFIWILGFFMVSTIIVFLFYMTTHLWTINVPLEQMRYDNLKKKRI